MYLLQTIILCILTVPLISSKIKFTRLVYNFKINENIPVNALIGKLDLSITEYTNFDVYLNTTRYDDSSRLFYIDKKTFEIKTYSSLESVTKSEHFLRAILLDKKTSSILSKCAIRIQILNDKNTAPKFLRPYEVQIFENNPPDTFVIQVQAVDSDMDENARLTYHLINNETTPSPFQIRSDTGEIFAKRVLDREQRDFYTLNIAAIDNGKNRLTATTKVFIRVVSQFDFQPLMDYKTYNLTLDENTDFTKRPVILKVTGSDRHTNSSNLTYSLSGSLNDLNTFEIDNFGCIRLVSKLNYKLKNFYKLNIYAQDFGQPACAVSSILNINILNKNSNVPTFSAPFYEFITFENVELSSKIGRVYSYDRDDSNSSISYSIESITDDFPFRIEKNGSILIEKKISKKIYEFYVTAKNSYSTTSSVKVKIKILDSNEQVPELAKKIYKLDINEDTAIGLPLLTLNVINKDSSSLLEYFIEQDDDNTFTLIKQSNTKVFLTLEKSNLNFKKKSFYQLNVKVVDQQDGLYSISKIEITVQPNIKYYPRFTRDIFTFKINENSPINTLIGTLTTVSNDYQVVYKLISGGLNENDLTNNFRLDDQTGNLYVSSYLDREKYESITLYASASYRDRNFRSDHVLIQIQVIDSNDNAPLFTRSFYQASIYKNTQIGDFLLRVEAVDRDAGNNGIVKYTILDDKSPVQIDTLTGVVRVSSKIKFDSMNLTILSSDLGEPSQNSKSYLYLKYVDQDNNPPYFDYKNLVFNIFENQSPGTVIGELFARDSEHGTDGDIIYKILNNDMFELRPSGSFNRVNLVSQSVFESGSSFNFTVRAYSGSLYSDCYIQVKVEDLTRNQPRVPERFRIIFNNYKNHFLTEETPRVPVENFDLAFNWTFALPDKIGQQLINLDHRTGEITLKSILNTNNLINTSFTISINDGENLVNTTCELIVSMISDNMISESVTLNLHSIDLDTFVSKYYVNFVDLISGLMKNVKKSNVHVFNLAGQQNGLNLSLSISQDYEKDKFVSSSMIKQIVYSNLEKLKSYLHINRINIYEDPACSIEPCLNFQKCQTNTKFQTASSTYIKNSINQFRSINVQHDFSCTCPLGFTGTNISVMCDTEINLCYSNPCGQNGVCLSQESSYVCVCDADYTGRMCEINLKKSKCNELETSEQVCRGSSVCKNLILGGFVCDKCESNEEPSASSYYTSLCQLRARNFPENSESYLVLPGLENRLRFKIKLKFSTVKSNGIIFYNGRLFNDTQDFISLGIDDDFLTFKYSFGDKTNEIKLDELSVTDGKWRTVTIEYKSRTVSISLDNDIYENIDSCELVRNFNKTSSECLRKSQTDDLDIKCKNQIENCFRYFDLNGPLYLGHDSSSSNHYEGCLSDVYVNENLIDLDTDVILNYKTRPGCAPKINLCELNSDKLKSNNCKKCSHLWSNKFKCECNENEFFDGVKCVDKKEEIYSTNKNGYLLFQEKIIEQSDQEIEISFDLKLRDLIDGNQSILYFKFSDNLIFYEFYVVYDSKLLSLTSQNVLKPIRLQLNKPLDRYFWTKLVLKFKKDGYISLSLDEIFSKEVQTDEIKRAFEEKFNYRWSIGGYKMSTGVSSCLKNVMLNGKLFAPYETFSVDKGCKNIETCDSTLFNLQPVLFENITCQKEDICNQPVCYNSGICSNNTRECTCPVGFKGKYCQYEKQISARITDQRQTCPAKWWGIEQGICGPCNCDESKNFSPDCDKQTGQCKCKSKFYKRVNKLTNEEECVPCDCYLDGSSSLECESMTGQCKCLPGAGITGRRCDKCVSPFAELTLKGNECRQLMTNECPRAFAFNIWWPRTGFNQMANSTCPKGSVGQAYRQCTHNGWAQNLDLSDCKSLKLSGKNIDELSIDKLTSYQAFKIVEELNKITLDSEIDDDDDTYALDEKNLMSTSQNSLYANDLLTIRNLTKFILEYETMNEGSFLLIQDKFFMNKIFSIIDKILSKKFELKINQFNFKTLNKHTEWTDLVICLKDYLGVLIRDGQELTPDEDIQISFDNLQFGLKHKRQDLYSESSVKFNINSNKIAYSSINMASYNLPIHLMLNSRQGSISTSTYRVVSNLFLLVSKNETKSSKIIIEFLLTNNYDVMYDPITNFLNYKNLRNSKLDYMCVHLNMEHKIWSNKGSKFISYDSSTNMVKCSYENETGIFGVITPVGTFIRTKTNVINFTIGFNIFISFSLIILSVTMILITLFKKTRRPLKLVHLNLCLNMFINQLIFVAGVNANDSQIICKFVSILEHYFNLSTYFWMFLISLHLYRMVTELRDVNKIGQSLPVFYYIIGYTSPVIVVGLSLGIKHDIYTNYDSTINFLNYPMNKLDLSSVYCWLNINNYNEIFFIFILPIGTLTFLILILSFLSYKQIKKNTFNQTDITLVYKNLFGSLIYLPFGCLLTVFLLLFLNSSQSAIQSNSIFTESFVYQHFYVLISLVYSTITFVSLILYDSENRSCLKKILNRLTHKINEDKICEEIKVKPEKLNGFQNLSDKIEVINVNNINAKYYRDFNTHSLSTTSTSGTLENTENSQMSDYVKHIFLPNGGGNNYFTSLINTTNTDTTCESDYNYNYDFNKLKVINNTQSIQECDVVDVGQVLKTKNLQNESYRARSPFIQNLNTYQVYSPNKFSNPIVDVMSGTLPRSKPSQVIQISPHYSESMSSDSKSSLVHINPDGTIERKYYKKANITSIPSIRLNSSVNIDPNLNHEDNETRV